MSINATQARVKSQIWKAIAQAQLDLSALPAGVLNQLVDVVTDAALLEMDAQLGDVDKRSDIGRLTTSSGTAEDEGEQLLWEGRPFLSLTTHYRITSERVRITRGLLGKEREDIELVKIQDIDQSQRLSERMLNIGDITIRSHDPSNPLVLLENVSDVQRVHELLRRAVLEARKKVNFSFREHM